MVRDTKRVTIKQRSNFRWLLLDAAMLSVFQVNPEQVLTLDIVAASESSKANGLLKQINIVENNFRIYVLECVNISERWA